MALTDTQERAAFLRFQYGTKEAARRVGTSERSLRRIANGEQSGETFATQITRVEAGARGQQNRQLREEGIPARRARGGIRSVGKPKIKSMPGTRRWAEAPDLEDLLSYLHDDAPMFLDDDDRLMPMIYIENEGEGDEEVWVVYVSEETP